MQTILAQSDRVFEPKQEEIGVVEALIPPAIVGAVVGGFTWASYATASQIASGEDVEVHGLHRRGLKRLLISMSEFLGTGGSIAVGSLLLVLILVWAANRVIHRPERTVWLPTAT